MTELYEAFERSSKKAFRFLLDDFGYTLCPVEKGPINVGIYLTYMSSRTAVQVGFEPTENLIVVYLIRLKHGKIPQYPAGHYYLDDLILVRSASLSTDNKRRRKIWYSPQKLEDEVFRYANALQRYGRDVLLGNFQTFLSKKAGGVPPRNV